MILETLLNSMYFRKQSLTYIFDSDILFILPIPDIFEWLVTACRFLKLVT
jgi:hypothetical protein